MKKYKIVVNYDTGDSFNQYPGYESELVEEWDNLDIAKENLKRIEAHNAAYRKIHGWGNYGKSRWENYKHEEWYTNSSPDWNLMLKKDDGNLYNEHTSWTGYFESMNYVEIRPDDSDMKVYAK